MIDAQRMSIVLDTSVLINFLAINRLDLLAQHPEFQFLVTEHVHTEVAAHYIEHLPELETALNNRTLDQIRVESIEELSLFARSTKNPRLGEGEYAAIAAAISRSCPLALDDKAARKVIQRSFPELTVLDTNVITLSLIRGERLSFEEAEVLKNTWTEEHGFRVSLDGFADFLGQKLPQEREILPTQQLQ